MGPTVSCAAPTCMGGGPNKAAPGGPYSCCCCCSCCWEGAPNSGPPWLCPAPGGMSAAEDGAGTWRQPNARGHKERRERISRKNQHNILHCAPVEHRTGRDLLPGPPASRTASKPDNAPAPGPQQRPAMVECRTKMVPAGGTSAAAKEPAHEAHSLETSLGCLVCGSAHHVPVSTPHVMAQASSWATLLVPRLPPLLGLRRKHAGLPGARVGMQSEA